MINHNNRPSISIVLAALSASAVVPLLYAHKKMRVLAISLVQEGAITASGANYLTYQAKKNNVAVGTAVDTQAGLAARVAKALVMPAAGYIELEAGDYLSLDVAETGTFAEGTLLLAQLDVEIVGN